MRQEVKAIPDRSLKIGSIMRPRCLAFQQGEAGKEPEFATPLVVTVGR